MCDRAQSRPMEPPPQPTDMKEDRRTTQVTINGSCFKLLSSVVLVLCIIMVAMGNIVDIVVLGSNILCLQIKIT